MWPCSAQLSSHTTPTRLQRSSPTPAHSTGRRSWRRCVLTSFHHPGLRTAAQYVLCRRGLHLQLDLVRMQRDRLPPPPYDPVILLLIWAGRWTLEVPGLPSYLGVWDGRHRLSHLRASTFRMCASFRSSLFVIRSYYTGMQRTRFSLLTVNKGSGVWEAVDYYSKK